MFQNSRKIIKGSSYRIILELKNDLTPAVVERLVIDVVSNVRVLSFPGWQRTNQGESEV